MQKAVIGFFDENQRWLAEVLREGQTDGSLTFHGDPAVVAQGILSTLEGAMLVARPYGNLDRFEATAGQMLDGLRA